MTRAALLALLSVALVLAATTSSAIEASLRPGGIAVIELDDLTAPRPSVSIAGKPVLLLQRHGRWQAVIGISLQQAVGVVTIEVDGEPTTLNINSHPYREQRLTVKNQDHVSPQPAQLQRITAERRLIDAAIANFRDQSLTSLEFATPVAGRRSSSFGSRRFFNDQPRSPHSGMDIAASQGTAVSVPLDGVVTLTGDFFFNGSTVMVDHGQGLVTLYCHLSDITVEQGQQVIVGQKLGAVGATGRVTGAHLHFGTYLNGVAVDPELLLAGAD